MPKDKTFLIQLFLVELVVQMVSIYVSYVKEYAKININYGN